MIKKFKSLSEVLKHHDIYYIESDFTIITTVKLNEVVREDIVFTLNEIPYKVSEASICENLIYPLLKAVWKLYANEFLLWSHQTLEDNEGGLRIPDYMISKRSELGKIIFDLPLLAVVEAKKDDFSFGWAQCSIDMIKMQQLNANNYFDIYGIVSNGEIWEIAKLTNQQFIAYKKRFFIEDVDSVFNALASVLQLCKQQLTELNLLTSP